MTNLATMLWRRVDTPGHDVCRLIQQSDGWNLEGSAIFRHQDGPANLLYSLRCEANWRTVWGRVRGYIGQRAIDHVVVHEGSNWMLDDVTIPGMDHLQDLDLSFTPATNLQQLRRVAISENETVRLPVAWLDVGAGNLSELPQIYERRGAHAFWYEAPSVGYEGLLELAPNGFVRSYPRLWQEEP